MMMNSLVASGHPLANVEQYPNSRMISFKWDSWQSAESLKKLFNFITKHQESLELESSNLRHSLIDWKKERKTLTSLNIYREIKLFERRLVTLEKSFVAQDMLGKFCESLYAFGLSDEQVGYISGAIVNGEYPRVSKNKRDDIKINYKLENSAFAKNRHEVFAINKRLAFLRNGAEVRARSKELDTRINNASSRVKELSNELADFGVVRSAFDKFYRRWNNIRGLTHIFGLYDSEMLFQRKVKVCYNLDMSYLTDVFRKVDVVTSKRFPLDKYFLVKDADVGLVLTKLLEGYPPLSDSAKLVKDFKIVVFTQQLSSVLSNIVDLDVFTLDAVKRMVFILARIESLEYGGHGISRDVAFAQAVSEFDSGKVSITDLPDGVNNYDGILSDLMRKIRVIIDFCVWLFEVNLSDDKPFDERLSAWISDQLDKADRIEGSGGSVEQLIGGSERHRTFRKNI